MDAWVYLLGHILVAVSLFVIAYKSAHPLSWVAFIPFVNLWLMVDMADLPLWVLLLFFVPFVQLLVYVWAWMKIAENTNKSEWLGLLMIVPIVNVAAALYMAFYEPDTIKA